MVYLNKDCKLNSCANRNKNHYLHFRNKISYRWHQRVSGKDYKKYRNTLQNLLCKIVQTPQWLSENMYKPNCIAN